MTSGRPIPDGSSLRESEEFHDSCGSACDSPSCFLIHRMNRGLTVRDHDSLIHAFVLLHVGTCQLFAHSPRMCMRVEITQGNSEEA